MVRITEEEITDIDGQVRKVRKIEAARARIERPDGTVEEYSGATAEEWPWPLPGGPPEWHLFGIPLGRILEQGLPLRDLTISLLSENGDIILKLGTIMIGIQMSASGRDHLAGSEIPLDN